MSEMLVIAHHTIAAGKEQDVLAVLSRLIEAVRAEPGNISFDAYRKMDDERSYVLLERYASRDALNAHRETAHFRDLVLGQIVPHLDRRVIEEFDDAEQRP